MFSFVHSALVSVLLSAVTVSALPSLSLKITGPDEVAGVNNLKVTTTLTNTGDETLRLLNDPRGPLSTMPTDTFNIMDASGSRPSFTGIKVKYVPAKAASIGDATTFTVLSPDRSIDVTHDLSSTYNFTLSGAGSYSFKARNLFHYVDDKNTIIPISAKVEPYSVSIAGKLAVVRPNLARRATFENCSADQQSLLGQAAEAAQKYAAGALSYATQHTDTTERYSTWFGNYTDSRHSTVVGHYTNMNGNDYSSYKFDCSCADSGTYAYVYPDEFGTVYLCGAFWKAPVTGTDSKGGTLVHESSHFTKNAGTNDHVYGQSGCKQLAQSNPDEAIDNADSHEYFVENNPELP